MDGVNTLLNSGILVRRMSHTIQPSSKLTEKNLLLNNWVCMASWSLSSKKWVTVKTHGTQLPGLSMHCEQWLQFAETTQAGHDYAVHWPGNFAEFHTTTNSHNTLHIILREIRANNSTERYCTWHCHFQDMDWEWTKFIRVVGAQYCVVHIPCKMEKSFMWHR